MEGRSLRLPAVYGISCRGAFPRLDAGTYLRWLFQTSAAILQWREKDQDETATRRCVRLGVEEARRTGKLFLVNSWCEIAQEEGADGVHLRADQQVPRTAACRPFLQGKSVHSLDDALRAQDDGADYVWLGPIFDPLSKKSYTAPLGLRILEETVKALTVPVFALGGIDASNREQVLSTGAAGIAGITLTLREVALLCGDQPIAPPSL